MDGFGNRSCEHVSRPFGKRDIIGPRRRQVVLASCAAALWLGGCERTPVSDGQPGSVQAPPVESNFLRADLAWYRDQMVDGNTGPRLKVAIAPNGFYAPDITRDWSLKREQRGTLITQTRAIYTMAAGYEVTGEAPYREACIRAADFLLTRFRAPGSPGLWARAVSPDGAIVDADIHLYGQMQAMFALAHAWRLSGEKRFLDAALGTWLALDVRSLAAARPGDTALNRLNVTLHAFEALLALHRAAPSTLLFDDLKALGDLTLRRFAHQKEGFFYEGVEDTSQRPIGGETSVGHNFQIAFLFSRAHDAGLPGRFLEAAQRALDFAVAHGIHSADGSVFNSLGYDRATRDTTLYWWSHTEALRCLAHFTLQRHRPALKPRFDAVLAFAKAHFIDPQYGGWYRTADDPDRGKGADWFAGYHEAMMSTEILRLAGWRFKSAPEMLL